MHKIKLKNVLNKIVILLPRWVGSVLPGGTIFKQHRFQRFINCMCTCRVHLPQCCTSANVDHGSSCMAGTWFNQPSITF